MATPKSAFFVAIGIFLSLASSAFAQVPVPHPAKPTDLQPLEDVTTMIDTVTSDGNRLLVMQGTRKAGTRAPIHFHDFGGYTCVLTGVITDYIEGQPPMTFPAGTCYYMPPDVPMTAVNLGTEDARLIDNFTLPPGMAPMNVLESGWTAPIPVP